MSSSQPFSGPTIDLSQRYTSMSGPTLRLAYASRRAPHASDDIMINLLLGGAVRNYLAGISAEIWISERFIMQVVEGTVGAVESLYRRICQDVHHQDVTCIDRARMSARTGVKPLIWHRMRNDTWPAAGVPFDEPSRPFDEACELLIRRGPITSTR